MFSSVIAALLFTVMQVQEAPGIVESPVLAAAATNDEVGAVQVRLPEVSNVSNVSASSNVSNVSNLPVSSKASGVPGASGVSNVPNVSEHISAILKEGKRLETECRFRKALELYEKSIRQSPNEKELQKRYSRAKIMCDIQKRFQNPSYIQTVEGMDEEHLNVFVRSVLQAHANHYVFELTPDEVFYREICSLEIAMGSSFFYENILAGQNPQAVKEFVQKIHQLPKRIHVKDTVELQHLTMQLGASCERRFGKKASFFVMECLFGFITSLDPYSEVLLPMQHQDLISLVSGYLIGVGIEFRTNTEGTRITTLIPNSPASISGLKVGDQILAVDGKSITNASMEQVSAMLQGDAGAWLTLWVQTGNDLPRTVQIQRKTIRYGSIEKSFLLPEAPQIGYVRITGFQQNSASELNQVMMDLHAKGMRNLILDLRGNPGGSLIAGVQMADLFLKQGKILQTRDFRNEQTYMAHPQQTWDIPIVLLIDEQSASATEVFAGAILENNRGQVVGSRSFGKGAMQGIYPIADTDFALKLTISHLYSPNGNRYNHQGIQPNLMVYRTEKPLFASGNDSATPPETFSESSSAEVKTSALEPQESDLVLQTAIQSFSAAR